MIHITSFGKLSFPFDFVIFFSHLQFTAGDFKFFQYIHFFFALILANLNPFVSFVLVVFLLIVKCAGAVYAVG